MPQAWLLVHVLHHDLAFPKRDRVASAWSPRLGPVFFGNANSFFSHLDAARSALCASTLSSTSLLPRAPALAGRACWHSQRLSVHLMCASMDVNATRVPTTAASSSVRSNEALSSPDTWR